MKDYESTDLESAAYLAAMDGECDDWRDELSQEELEELRGLSRRPVTGRVPDDG